MDSSLTSNDSCECGECSDCLTLEEGKAVGTYVRKRRDLRALEAQAHAIVHGKKHAGIVKRQTKESNRQVDQVKAQFHKKLAKEIKSYETGTISHTTLVNRTSSDIRNAYQSTYSLGLKARGHGALATDARPTGMSTSNVNVEDAQWLRSAAEEEIGYWKNFMRDIRHGVVPDEDDEDRQPTRRMVKQKRLKMYVDSLDAIYAAGQVRGMPDDLHIINWVFGHAEHCPECIYLEQNSPFTKEALPTTPRAGTTRCLTNCKCKIVIQRVPRAVYDEVKKRQKKKEHHLRQLERSRKLKLGLPSVAKSYMEEEALSRDKPYRTRH